MTGAELLAYIKRTFKRTDKDTELYEAITDTITAIKNKKPTEDFRAYSDISVSANDWRFAYESDFEYVTKFVLLDGDDSRTLKRISFSKIMDLEQYPDRSGVDTDKPSHVAVEGKYIYIFRPSDDSYTLRVWHTTATDDYAVAAGTDPVPFSARYREMLKAGALYRIYRDLTLDNEAAKWEVIFQGLYEDFQDLEYDNTNDEQRVVFNDK